MGCKQIEPSLLAFNKTNMLEQLQHVKALGVEIIHYDIMDEYVSNTSFGTEHIQLILNLGFKVNVHIMVTDPLAWIEKLADFKISTLTFQFEAVELQIAKQCLIEIKKANITAGIAIKPFTLPSQYLPLLPIVEILTIMTVEPGKGGQPLLENGLLNLEYVFKYRYEHKLNYLIEVDGGIKIDNVDKVLKHSDLIISGTGFMQITQTQQSAFIKKIKGV